MDLKIRNLTLETEVSSLVRIPCFAWDAKSSKDHEGGVSDLDQPFWVVLELEKYSIRGSNHNSVFERFYVPIGG